MFWWHCRLWAGFSVAVGLFLVAVRRQHVVSHFRFAPFSSRHKTSCGNNEMVALDTFDNRSLLLQVDDDSDDDLDDDDALSDWNLRE